jgi:hypothetical protein
MVQGLLAIPALCWEHQVLECASLPPVRGRKALMDLTHGMQDLLKRPLNSVSNI